MKRVYFCSHCKRKPENVYLDRLAGISAGPFPLRCTNCDSPVIELSEKEERVELPELKRISPEKRKPEKLKGQSGRIYGGISIAAGVAGLALPFPFNVFPGMAAIAAGAKAVSAGDSRAGKAGIILGFLSFIPFLYFTLLAAF